MTGGAGFIGSHLVDDLIGRGVPVHVVDNLSTGHLHNLEQHRGSDLLSFHHLDVGIDLERLTTVFEGARTIFHLAALADIVPSIQRPLDYHRSNVDGTFNVLEAARKVGVDRLVYAASSSCYGIPDEYPTPETAELRPQYPYAVTKLLGEEYVLRWNRIYGLPTVSLRLFNVYGPRARTSGTYGAVFGVFLAQKLAAEPFTVVGDGTQSRDFTFVSDIVEGFWRAAVVPGVEGEVINLGSKGHYTVNRLVELLGGDVVHIPKRPGEPEITWADASKAQRLLGWDPQVSFEDGVKVMVENIDYWRDAPVWTPETIEEATKEWFQYLEDP